MLKDLEQKLRNRPIKITDIAISKVRKILVPGFNNDENRFIQEQHKRLLSISKNINNSEEVAIVIDIIHWDSEVILGKENRVKMENNKHANEMLLACPKNTLLAMQYIIKNPEQFHIIYKHGGKK